LKSLFPAKTFSKKVSQNENGIIINAKNKNIDGKLYPKKCGNIKYNISNIITDIIPSAKPCQNVLLNTCLLSS